VLFFVLSVVDQFLGVQNYKNLRRCVAVFPENLIFVIIETKNERHANKQSAFRM